MEEKGIQGRWKGRQLQDSIQVFADLVKKHYGKYPVIYSNESFYNKEMGAKFNRYYLFIANYNSRQPSISGNYGREFQPGTQDCVSTAAER